MSGRSFLDTNIFVYAVDRHEPNKRQIALDLIRKLTIGGDGVISYQVVHEFFNVVLRKTSHRMSSDEATLFLEDVLRPLRIIPSSFTLISDAIHIQDRYRLSWYDSLIVSAAQQAGCSTLYSEDLQHGQQFGAVTVRNPFV
jgi:predicted nucleic acid-binding protein